MIRVGVIGYGYWGPNLVRNFMEAPGSTVVVVSDGIIEAKQAGTGEQFGVERTIAAIAAAGATASSTAIADSIRATVDSWMAGSPAADDQTLLIVSLPRG